LLAAAAVALADRRPGDPEVAADLLPGPVVGPGAGDDLLLALIEALASRTERRQGIAPLVPPSVPLSSPHELDDLPGDIDEAGRWRRGLQSCSPMGAGWSRGNATLTGTRPNRSIPGDHLATVRIGIFGSAGTLDRLKGRA
jgi:hypothetical protein